MKPGAMKTKQFCPECDRILDGLTAALRRLFEICSKIRAVVEMEGWRNSPKLDVLLAQNRTLMSECASIREGLREHRGSGHAVTSTFGR